MANPSMIEEVTLLPSISVVLGAQMGQYIYGSGTHDVLIMYVCCFWYPHGVEIKVLTKTE